MDTTNPKELHAIIDDVLDAIRKRPEEDENGNQVVVEEFILLDEFIPGLQDKLLKIEDEEEKREALLSIFAFSMMVEKQGWGDNAKKIRELGLVLGDLYHELQQTIANRLGERSAKAAEEFIGKPTDQLPSTEDLEQAEEFDPLDDDF